MCTRRHLLLVDDDAPPDVLRLKLLEEDAHRLYAHALLLCEKDKDALRRIRGMLGGEMESPAIDGTATGNLAAKVVEADVDFVVGHLVALGIRSFYDQPFGHLH